MSRKIDQTVDQVLRHYKLYKRDFPWRHTKDSYCILVSEYMLQQTQTERVIPKYISFIEQFPTVEDLATSSRTLVLQFWSGLGYNRRGIFLHTAAKYILSEWDGVILPSKEKLMSLPGVGEYTAAAVLAFAFNKWDVAIETNIRTVVFYHQLCEGTQVGDSEVQEVVALLWKRAKEKKVGARVFYSALMDYGAYLKKNGVKLNIKSKHYVPQKKFDGSVRQARGMILRSVLSQGLVRKSDVSFSQDRTHTALHSLVSDGTLIEKSGTFYLAEGKEGDRTES